ncbi:MAG: helix-turn-helix transcriptional regulator, partial [Alistipes sp.]
SFGWLFQGLILSSFGILYYKQLFYATPLTWRLLLWANVPLLVGVVGYVVLSLLGHNALPHCCISELDVFFSFDEPFGVLWLLTLLSLLIYVGYFTVYTVGWICNLLWQNKQMSMRHNIQHYGTYITTMLCDLAILLTTISLLFIHDEITESIVVLILSAFYLISVLLSHSLTREGVQLPCDQQLPTEKVEVEKHILRSNDKLLIDKLEELMLRDEIFRHKDLSTENLAELLHISRKKLYLVIKEHYNITFTEYINHQRLECAVKLMKDKESLNMTTIQIAEAVGFNSLKTFNKFFKDKYAVTPTQYRNSPPITQ